MTVSPKLAKRLMNALIMYPMVNVTEAAERK